MEPNRAQAGSLSASACLLKTISPPSLNSTNPMDSNTTDTLELVPGRTYSIPVPTSAGETTSVTTSSNHYWDTILVLLGPDGTPVAGADVDWFYFAELDWVAEQAGTYLLQVTFFESVNSGEVVVTRD